METCFTSPISQKHNGPTVEPDWLQDLQDDIGEDISEKYNYGTIFTIIFCARWKPRGFDSLGSFMVALKYHEYLHEKAKALSQKLFLFIDHPFLALARHWLEVIREVAALLLLFWCLSTGIRYKRPKHVICAAMPWTILPCLIILWGVCWMFYNASQASPPALGFEFQDYFNQFDGGFDHYQGLDFGLLDHSVGLFGSSIDQLEPAASGAPIGIFSGSDVPIQAESRHPIPELQQQQEAEIPSAQPGHSLASENRSGVPAQTLQPEQARQPLRCTESGCHSEFGTERELRRHRETVHDRSEFPCTVTGCKRGAQNPFNRLDNLQRHMRKAHGQSEPMPTTALRITTMRGQKRRADTASSPEYSPESRRRRTEDAQDSMISTLNPPPASCHAQDEVARLREQLADARKREEIHVARIKALEKEAEAQAVKFEALRKDNEVQDAYIKLLGRKG